MTDKERIEELEEALAVVQDGLKTAAEINYAQSEELKTLRPVVEAITTLWRYVWCTAPIQ